MKEKSGRKRKIRTVDAIYISLFTALIAVCSYISIPTAVPFTMQTFGIFCALGLLGGKRGLLSVAVYVSLGLAGAPVFSGFRGGIGVLFERNGGYIVGFIAAALVYYTVTACFKNTTKSIVAAMLLGQLVCYISGSLWLAALYISDMQPIGFLGILSICVLPFIIPDLLKITLAVLITNRLSKYFEQ